MFALVGKEELSRESIHGRCSVLAKLKTGWKLMGVRTVVAKYLHAGPAISIKVNPSRRLAPPFSLLSLPSIGEREFSFRG